MTSRKEWAITLLNDPASSSKITALLLGSDRHWILTEPLDDVFVSLLALYGSDRALLDGEVMALMAKRLIATEQQPGGPYGADIPGDIEANVAIAQLFTLLEAPLPQVNAYVLSKRRGETSELFDILFGYGDLTASQLALKKSGQKPSTLVTLVEKEIAALKQPLKKTATLLWEEMQTTRNYHEIISFSKDFGYSFEGASHLAYDTLARANIYFWLAGIVYDDFIDEEGVAVRLPVANTLYRWSVSLYESMLAEQKELIENYFRTMDEANAWELEHCRFAVNEKTITIGTFPSYGDNMILARRALGHIVGPLIITTLQKTSGTKQKNIYNGLCHYLIARQLNDDLHDWAEDVERGHISPIVTLLLKGLNVKKGILPLDATIDAMRTYFFKQGCSKGCEEVLAHTKKARELLLKTNFLKPSDPFFTYIATTEAVAKEALEKWRQNHIFLEKYSR